MNFLPECAEEYGGNLPPCLESVLFIRMRYAHDSRAPAQGESSSKVSTREMASPLKSQRPFTFALPAFLPVQNVLLQHRYLYTKWTV